jgi:phosphate acetyltransferase
MSKSLYITASEMRSGKSIVALGVMEMIMRRIHNAAFFRPIIHVSEQNHEMDSDIALIKSHFNLTIPYEQMYGLTMAEATRLFSLGKKDEITDRILSKFSYLEEHYDFVLCEGTDFEKATSAFEFNFNANTALDLGCPILLVSTAFHRDIDETLGSIEMAINTLNEKDCQIVAIIVNRVEPSLQEELLKKLVDSDFTKDELTYAIPDKRDLKNPTVGEVAKLLDAQVLHGEEELNRHVCDYTIAAMQLHNFIPTIQHGTLIITPGDRADLIIASLAALTSLSMHTISGIVMTGGLMPEPIIWKLITGFPQKAPILYVNTDTFTTAIKVDSAHAKIDATDALKISSALSTFEKNVAVHELSDRLIQTKTTVITPKMFEYDIVQQARLHKQRIVLPEGEEERILRAAEILRLRDIVNITLLGSEKIIQEKISQLGIDLKDVEIIEPSQSDRLEEFAQTYYDLRKEKAKSLDYSRDRMKDVNYFGTMMIYKGLADGMVSGSVHSTADTIRPSLQFIKTKPGFSIVSSVFFMCLSDRTLVYGDCAINPNPNASELAEIALTSALTAKAFGIEPKVAMLSYSTGESGKGEDVDLVREATKIAQEKTGQIYPGLKIEGPIQYDAAVDREVAKTKMPNSEVAGNATVLIFPDLNTGNNTYKAVQRSADAVAIGPVIQGLKFPVNDLSRGCTVIDIVNTVAITAIQAQFEKGLL